MTIRDSVLTTRIASHLRINTSFYTKLIFLSGCSRRAHTTINHPSFFWCLLFVFGTLDYHHYLLLNSFFLFFHVIVTSPFHQSHCRKVQRFSSRNSECSGHLLIFSFFYSHQWGVWIWHVSINLEKSHGVFFFFWTLFSNVYRLLWALLHLYKFITINICHFHVHHCHYMY